jgi:hypothetical protein
MARLTRRVGTLWTCVLGACAATAYAQGAPAAEPAQVAEAAEVAEPARDPLAAALDPLDRARIVAQLGDARVLALMTVARAEHGAVVDVDRVLPAVLSAPWLSEASRALPLLLELMPGRDPDLAPAAAQAVVEIARGLVEGARVPESAGAEQLKAWTTQLAVIEQNARVRADIRLAATEAIALLNAAAERL